MMTTAISHNGLWLCRKSYAVRSAITATAAWALLCYHIMTGRGGVAF